MTQQVFKENNLSELKSYINSLEKRKIFIVADSLSYSISGAKQFIENTLQLNDNIVFTDFNPNPQIEDLRKGIRLFNSKSFEFIIAIGGGSVLDMAKLISVMAHQTENLEEITKGNAKINNNKTKLLVIPTTAGTGAEATAFSVLYINKIKYSVASKLILPDIVFLSSEFSMSAPPYLTASTGLDAFSQAIESVWSVNSNTQSQEYAFKAIELVWNNLEKAVNKNNKQAKQKMQEAAFLAGKAINITKTTAPHALSYGFTSYYNIPHGHAVILSLNYFLEFNYNVTDSNCTDSRGAEAVKKRIDKILQILDTNISNVKVVLNSFYKSININTNISVLINNFDANLILNSTSVERLNNNPRKVTKSDINIFLIDK